MSKSKNKSTRLELERIYGKGCMIERAGIRYIPMEKRKKIKGYSKNQEKMTYHHIKEVKEGGKATVENGAVLKAYNHAWLHTLPEDQKQEVNRKLQDFKLHVLEMTGNGEMIQAHEVPLEFSRFELGDEEFITIEVYDTTPEQRKQLKKKKVKEERKHRGETYDEKRERRYGIDYDEGLDDYLDNKSFDEDER